MQSRNWKQKYPHHFFMIWGNWILAIVWNLRVNTFSIVMSKSRAVEVSVSLLWRMQSTRFSSNLHDIVWMLVGRDSSWTFLENKCTAFASTGRLRFCLTWWVKSAKVEYASGRRDSCVVYPRPRSKSSLNSLSINPTNSTKKSSF